LGAIAHQNPLMMAVGLSILGPKEDAVLATLKSKATEAGPLVLFHPSGGEPMEPKQLVV